MTKDAFTEFLDAWCREQGWDPYHSSPEQDQRLKELTEREREHWPDGVLPTEREPFRWHDVPASEPSEFGDYSQDDPYYEGPPVEMWWPPYADPADWKQILTGQEP